MNPDGNGSDGKPRNAVSGWKRWMAPGLVVLGLVMVVGFGAFVVFLLTWIDEQQSGIYKLREEISRNRRMLSVFESDEVLLTRLSPAGDANGLSGNLLWDPETRRALLRINNVSPSDTAYDYTMWTVGNSGISEVIDFRIAAPSLRTLLIEQIQTGENQSTDLVVTRHAAATGSFQEGTVVLTGSLRR